MDSRNNDTPGVHGSDSFATERPRAKSSEPVGNLSGESSLEFGPSFWRDPANVEWNRRLGLRLPPYVPEPPEMIAAMEAEDRAKRKRQEESEGSSEMRSARPSASPELPPAPKRRRRPIPADWEPPLAVGSCLGENLSRIEEAERLVMQWEAIIENARRTQPMADLSPFERKLESVRRELEELEETEENLAPPDELESIKQAKISGRLEELEEALNNTESPEGWENIQGVIDGYTDGSIPCWEKWTLVYGGRIVDTCPNYESFTQDRKQRLDHYLEQYGKGWLWFEPPLAPKDNIQPDRLLAATWAQPKGRRSNVWDGESGWEITMGFRRVKTFHSREGKPDVLVTGDATKVEDPANEGSKNDPTAKRRRSSCKVLPYVPTGRPKPKKSEKWVVRDDDDDDEGIRCFFLMQLDSGASLPCLYKDDLRVLGIDPASYPAQSQVNLFTANGSMRSPIYELRVDVCRYNGQSLVGDNPVWPQERHEIGGITPVAVLNSEHPPKGSSGALSLEELRVREKRGEDVSEEALAKRYKKTADCRLSGLLPFRCCYLGGAPGMRLWLGEDRRDVLGADRMPGQRRYEPFKQSKLPKAPVDLGSLERPNITFEHEVGDTWIVDKDIEDRTGASIMTVKSDFKTQIHRLEPRKLPSQQPKQPKKSYWELKEEKARNFYKTFGRFTTKRRHDQVE